MSEPIWVHLNAKQTVADNNDAQLAYHGFMETRQDLMTLLDQFELAVWETFGLKDKGDDNGKG